MLHQHSKDFMCKESQCQKLHGCNGTDKEGIWWLFKDNFCQFSIEICCRRSLESPHPGNSNEYPQLTFLWRNKQNYPLIITKYSHLFFCGCYVWESVTCSKCWETKFLSYPGHKIYLWHIACLKGTEVRAGDKYLLPGVQYASILIELVYPEAACVTHSFTKYYPA